MATRQLQKFTFSLWLALMQVAFNLNAQSLDPNQTKSPKYLPYTMEWTINGTTRKALVYLPPNAKTESTPVIFAFHGHGGTMQNMYKTRGFDQLWPEAIFICPQGLNTPGMLTDPEGKRSGWQMSTGQDNRDLQFFDAMMSTLNKDYKIDQKRIFVTGHSNGGGFTYLLLATRGNIFAAIAPTATAGGKLLPIFKPKPVLHLMGESDSLVKPIWQKQTYNLMLKLNQCETSGTKIDEFTTFYPSKTGNPVVLFIHPGGHTYPKEANEAIVSFFKRFGN